MRRHLWIFACLLGTILSSVAVASTDLDKLYTLRNVIGVIVNPDREAINGEAVENELVKQIRKQPRFVFQDAPFLQLKEIIKSLEGEHKTLSRERIRQLLPLVRQLNNGGVDAVIFAYVEPALEKYAVELTFVNASNSEILSTSSAEVDDPNRLVNFANATDAAMVDLLKQLPFDGTLLAREGYRVILDRGRGDLRVGMELPVYTVEKMKKEPKPTLEETGLILVTQVDDSLSFGKILVDKKPREVALGNKILLPSRPNFRSLSSTMAPEVAKPVPARRYGFLDARAGFSALSLNQTPSDGSAAQTNGVMYPTLDLTGEVWINSRFYVQGILSAGISSIHSIQGAAPRDLSSGVSDVRVLAGYRLPVFGSVARLNANFSLGYAHHQFSVETPNSSLQFNNSSYGGMYFSAGAEYPFSSTFALSLDLATFLFSGFDEFPATSGSSPTGSGVFEMVLKAAYTLTADVNLDARLRYLGAGATFTGQGTRPTPLASLEESVTALTVGASYFF